MSKPNGNGQNGHEQSVMPVFIYLHNPYIIYGYTEYIIIIPYDAGRLLLCVK